ncbi:MAG: PAS domain-containing sensor histidine kinase [Bacteroidia bacterium]
MQNATIQDLESKNIFRILFESAGEGLVLVDKTGTILLVNPRLLELFEFTENELIGSEIEKLIPADYHHRHRQHRMDYVATPKKRSMGHGMNLWGLKKSGKEFPVEVSLNYLNSDGEILVMALVTDITNRKEYEDELQKLNADLEKRVSERTEELAGAILELEYTNKSLEKAEEDVSKALQTEKDLSELKSRFLSTASHEFRTPLATILSSVTLISRYSDESDKEKRLKHIERIKSSIYNLREILNEFLSLEKLNAGIIHNSPVEVNITAFMQELVEEMQQNAKQRQKIHYQHIGHDTIVVLDPNSLKNIMNNLFSNAIKFCDEDKNIFLVTEKNSRHLYIELKDEGIGISEEDQKYLFGHFFRAKNAINIQGTGLGLNIVQKYVELMRGEITFSSVLGEGTTFKITFPV